MEQRLNERKVSRELKRKLTYKEKWYIKQRGITLIALVITIIVLLILAGVTIATLTGENGILTRASEASKETEITSVKEQAQLDITNWMAGELENGRDGIVNDWEDIKSILDSANPDTENRYYVSVTEEGIETPNGYLVPIDELYTSNSGGEDEPAFDANDLTIGTAINADKYGQKVTNYTVKTSEMSTNIWRLFYQDSNYTYLITDECIGIYKPSNYYSPYTNGSMVSIIGQKLNPMLLEAGTFFVEMNIDSSILTTAWLTDTTNWSTYVDDEDVVFAIGSPTLELYVASFNATASANGATPIATLTLGTHGYRMPARVELETSYNYGIYNKNLQSKWWIASPTSGGSGQFVVNASERIFSDFSVSNSSFAVRPIVCIPTSVFNSKYLSSLVDE